MSEITPITREEKLWNGEDLEPITREEMYIKRIFDKTQTIPDKPLTRKEILMEKAGEGGGGDVTIKQLSVTANGTYSEEGTAYSPVNVAVPLAEKSVTENGTYNASDDNVAGYSKVNVNVPLPENAYLLKEASGSLVSFSDGADLPMPSFVCDIDPVQDIHGYDAPWVGGSGKNKLVYPYYHTTRTSGGVLFTDNGDGSITLTNSATDNGFFSLEFSMSIPNGNYIFRANTQGGDSTSIYIRMQIDSTDSPTNYLTNTDTPITVTNNEIYNIQIRVQTGGNPNGCVVYPFLRLSTDTDTNWSPYSNICPISGHTGLNAAVSPTTEASAGTTYSISWQTEAGEVFGGYIDLVSGVLTVTHKSQTGFTRGSHDSSNKLYNIGTIANIKTFIDTRNISPYYINSMFEKMSLVGARAAETPSIVQHDATLYVGGYIGKAAELDTLLESLQVKYELATPITYQLTPTQIKSLLGNNNAWCSTGDVDIDYFAKEV